MTDGAHPPEIVDAARRRSAARAARDWATADQLRAEIEAAGWRVVDSGTAFRLEAAHAPELIEDGVVRYGRSEAVPSRLDEPDEGLATVVIVGTEDASAVVRALAALRSTAPSGLSVVVVANGMDPRAETQLEEDLGAEPASTAGSVVAPPGTNAPAGTKEPPGTQPAPFELIRTSARLGHATALNIGIRRSSGAAVILLDPSVEAEADIAAALIRVLDDPTVAVTGAVGFRSGDLRKFEEAIALGPATLAAAAIEGHLVAFRRADAAARGPLDEQFRVARHLDIWWSLVLRDEGEDRLPRRALVVPNLPLRRHKDRGPTLMARAELERLAKRNFYRVLDRFGRRLDLAVP